MTSSSEWRYGHHLAVYDQDGRKFMIEFENKIKGDGVYTRGKLVFTPFDVLSFLVADKQLDDFEVSEDYGDLNIRQPKHILKQRLVDRAKRILPDINDVPILVFQHSNDFLMTVYFPVVPGLWDFGDSGGKEWFDDIDSKANEFDDDYIADEEFDDVITRMNA